MRSEIMPQNWRVTKAVPSTTESMAALCVGAMPRSVQKATRWLCGMAMGTQHMKAAATIRVNIVLGRSPRTAALCSEPEPAGAVTGSGGARKKKAASGTTTAISTTA